MWNRLRISALSRRRALALTCLFALAPFVALAAQRIQPPAQKTRVAVMHFTAAAAGPNRADYDAYSVGFQVLLAHALQSNPDIEVMERARLRELMTEQELSATDRVDPATVVRIGKVLGVKHMLLGAFVVQPDKQTRLIVTAVNTETGAHVHSESVGGRGDRIFELLDRLASQLNKGLKLPGDRDPNAVKDTGLDGPNQQEALIALHAAERYKEKGDFKSATTYLQKALKLNPGIGYARRELAALERRAP